MIKYFLPLFLVFLIVSINGYSQTDLSGIKPLKIETAQKLDPLGQTNQGTSLKMPSVLDDDPEVSLDLYPKNPVQMLPERELVQAGYGLKIDPKIRTEKQGETGKHFGNQYLGDIKNNGKFIGIVCRDHEFVDGDRAKITVNGVVIDANILLTSSFKGVNVDLKKGFNRIEFEALNEGTSSPNTAQINVYDDKSQLIYSNQWLLSEGSKATFIITKE